MAEKIRNISGSSTGDVVLYTCPAGYIAKVHIARLHMTRGALYAGQQEFTTQRDENTRQLITTVNDTYVTAPYRFNNTLNGASVLATGFIPLVDPSRIDRFTSIESTILLNEGESIYWTASDGNTYIGYSISVEECLPDSQLVSTGGSSGSASVVTLNIDGSEAVRNSQAIQDMAAAIANLAAACSTATNNTGGDTGGTGGNTGGTGGDTGGTGGNTGGTGGNPVTDTGPCPGLTIPCVDGPTGSGLIGINALNGVPRLSMKGVLYEGNQIGRLMDELGGTLSGFTQFADVTCDRAITVLTNSAWPPYGWDFCPYFAGTLNYDPNIEMPADSPWGTTPTEPTTPTAPTTPTTPTTYTASVTGSNFSGLGLDDASFTIDGTTITFPGYTNGITFTQALAYIYAQRGSYNIWWSAWRVALNALKGSFNASGLTAYGTWEANVSAYWDAMEANTEATWFAEAKATLEPGGVFENVNGAAAVLDDINTFEISHNNAKAALNGQSLLGTDYYLAIRTYVKGGGTSSDAIIASGSQKKWWSVVNVRDEISRVLPGSYNVTAPQANTGNITIVKTSTSPTSITIGSGSGGLPNAIGLSPGNYT